jgi:hypothetical protein
LEKKNKTQKTIKLSNDIKQMISFAKNDQSKLINIQEKYSKKSFFKTPDEKIVQTQNIDLD